MTHEQEVEYTKMGLGIAGHPVSDYEAELIVSIHNLVKKMKGKTGIKEVLDISVPLRESHKMPEHHIEVTMVFESGKIISANTEIKKP